MGEEGEVWRDIKAKRRERRQVNRVANVETIAASGIPFDMSNAGETMTIREPGKPPVDFWPSTGRWRIPRAGSKTFNGGARAFLVWYGKQVE